MANPKPGMKAKLWIRSPIWWAARISVPKTTTMPTQRRNATCKRICSSAAGHPQRRAPQEADELEEHDERNDLDVRATEGDDVGGSAEHREHRLRKHEAEQGERDGQDGPEDQALLQDVVRFAQIVRSDGARDEGDRPGGHADHHAEEEEDELGAEVDRGHGGGSL